MIDKLNRTMETDIILAAKQLIEEGKEPTVALVKARLSRPLTMPVIIMVLQKIAGLSLEKITKLLPADVIAAEEKLKEQTLTEATLHQEVTRLSNELIEVRKQLTTLTQKFETHLKSNLNDFS